MCVALYALYIVRIAQYVYLVASCVISKGLKLAAAEKKTSFSIFIIVDTRKIYMLDCCKNSSTVKMPTFLP